MIGTHFKGRLGNNLYQYAYIRSVSERFGYDFFITEESTDTFKVFEDFFPHLQFNKGFRNYTNVLNEYDALYKDKFYNLKDNTYVSGFFQNHRYFDRNDAKEWFKIYLDNEQQNIYDEIIDKYNPEEYCYINFRGTDYMSVKEDNERTFFDRSQYISQKSKFIVLTDDVENARKYIKAEEYFAPNHKITLKLISSAKTLIIPALTTFAWWGAWLGDTELVLSPDIQNLNYIRNDIFRYV